MTRLNQIKTTVICPQDCMFRTDRVKIPALHTCFGYAHVVHARPEGYPFLAELAPYISQMDTLQRSMFLNQVRDLAMGRRRSA